MVTANKQQIAYKDLMVWQNKNLILAHKLT